MTRQSTDQRIISILVIAHLIGCTTMKPIEPPPHATGTVDTYVERLKKGDHIAIYPTSGESMSLEVVAVTDEELRGKTSTDLEVIIPIADIARIERKEFSAGDTATAVVGGGIATVFLFFTIIGPLLFVLVMS
mgnify:FL=1